ncbi:hypothetical protein EDC04DRAFT_2558879 [Pisolithus marmoratus]|nr:hypothetical protein EDC04DRAFT_2558879 [Pisolithus marmoratus]
MLSQSFFVQKHQQKLVQPPSLLWTKVVLTQEACKELLAQWQSKNKCFKQDLDSAWQQIDDTMKTIALANHKSISHVQHELYLGHSSFRTRCSKLSAWNTFCWKKKKNTMMVCCALHLSSIIYAYASDIYKSLSMEEKKTLIEEYAQHKERKTFGLHATAKSKVNNIMETLKALTSLQYHMGAETMLYTTHGSTDLPLHRVAFATEGIENFMGTMMHIDNQDLVSKMEGFAIQGIKGVAANYQQCISQVQEIINAKLHKCLSEITGEPNAKMQWAHYFCNVVTCYLVAIEGWPNGIPFTNLSTVSSALPDLEMLLSMWESGSIFWKLLNNQDYETLCHEHDAKLNSGELIEGARRTHSDKGTKQARQNLTATRDLYHTFKSLEMILTDTDDEDNAERDTAHTPAGVAATPEDRDINPTTAHTTNTDTSSDMGINTTSRLMPATEQASCSSMHYHDQPMTLHILEINLDLALHNLNQNYDTMWLQGNGGDTYRFNDQDRHGFDDRGRYGFGDQNGIPFSY